MSNIYGGFAARHGQTMAIVTMGSFVFQILDFSWEGLERAALEVTSMSVQPTTGTGLGNKMFIPSMLVDPGALALKVLHDPTQVIPITDPSKAGPVDVTFKVGPATTSQQTFVAKGFMTSYVPSGTLDGTAMTATLKLKLTDLVDNTFGVAGAVSVAAAT